MMRILMTGGGTAGHINPALTIAAMLKERIPDTEFLFVGAKGRMESTLVPAAGYPIELVDVRGFQRRISLKAIKHNIAAAYHAVAVQRRCSQILKQFRPDIAIGTGGYVSGPILHRAAKMGIPVVVHESNVLPGVTVRMLAKHARAVLVADARTLDYLPSGTNGIVTGNPLRRDFMTVDRASARRQLSLDDRPVLLSFGGSLGARAINEAMLGVMEKNRTEGHPLRIICASGKNGYAFMTDAMKQSGLADDPSVTLLDYIHEMPTYMAAADLVVCRCGAMTLSELPAAGKPSILIPSPYVAENHQYHNAMALASKGAALCIEEKDLTTDILWQSIKDTVLCPEKLNLMKQSAAAAAVFDASDRIYDAIRQVLDR